MGKWGFVICISFIASCHLCFNLLSWAEGYHNSNNIFILIITDLYCVVTSLNECPDYWRNLNRVLKEVHCVIQSYLLHECMLFCPFQMKSDFKKMEDEMDLLAANMESITSFSEQISCTLQV
jgi:hypothetical protein